MTKKEHSDLIDILSSPHFDTRLKALKYVQSIEPEEEVKGQRTDAQHRALFKWFSMIEHEAENAGITWNMIIRHTHQLRITKESLHGTCKALMEALWGTKSTKELKKTGQIDIIIDHFVDLFAKEGLELPEFPHMDDVRFAQMENLSSDEYPEYDPDKHEPII